MFKKFLRDKKASTAAYIMELMIAVFMVAYLIPPAIVALTCSTSWVGANATVITLGTTVLGILIIMGVALALMPKELKGKIGMWAKSPIAKFARVGQRHIIRSFTSNKRGSSTVAYIMELAIAIFMVAYLLPPAMVALTASASWTGAPASIVTIGTVVLGILVILGVAMALMPKELKAKMGV
jgi:uncharacterized integral membrane protein